MHWNLLATNTYPERIGAFRGTVHIVTHHDNAKRQVENPHTTYIPLLKAHVNWMPLWTPHTSN